MLELTVDYDLSPGEVSVDHSFICRSYLTSTNVTATIGMADYGSPVTSTLKNIQIQAFNTIKNEQDFVDCEYSWTKICSLTNFYWISSFI